MSDVATIVADVRERGDAALADWSLRLDGVEPARAVPERRRAGDAILALADAVRRWHERQRPADIVEEIVPASSSSGGGRRSRPSGSTCHEGSCLLS